MSKWEDTQGQTQDTLEELHISFWECLGIPQGELEGITLVQDVWFSSLSLMPPRPGSG